MSYNAIRRQHNQAIINHVLRSRRIYDTIVQNMQRENDMLITALANRPYYILQSPQSYIQTQTQPQPETQTQTHPQTRANPVFMNLMDILLRGNGDMETEANRGLTTEQIDNAITNHIFCELPESARSQYTTCPITLENFNNNSEVSVLRVCGHVFFRQPLRIWLEGRDTCPTCRTRVIQSTQEANPSQQHQEQPYVYRSNPNAMTYLFTFPNNDTNTNTSVNTNPNTSENNEANPLMSLIDNLVNQATQQITRGTNLGFGLGLELDNSGNISSETSMLGAGIDANTNPYSNNNIWSVRLTDADWRAEDISGVSWTHS